MADTKCRCSELLDSAIEWIFDHIPGDEYFGSYRDTRCENFAIALRNIGYTYTECRKLLVEDYCFDEKMVDTILDDHYEEQD